MLKVLFGHTSIITADNYFGDFEEEQHVEVAKNFISLQSIAERLTSKEEKEKPFNGASQKVSGGPLLFVALHLQEVKSDLSDAFPLSMQCIKN